MESAGSLGLSEQKKKPGRAKRPPDRVFFFRLRVIPDSPKKKKVGGVGDFFYFPASRSPPTDGLGHML
jgi:hypothetical protein